MNEWTVVAVYASVQALMVVAYWFTLRRMATKALRVWARGNKEE